MALLGLSSATDQVLTDTRRQKLITQTITRLSTTLTATVTLGGPDPTDDQAYSAPGPRAGELSQEELGGLIGGLVAIVFMLIVSAVCCCRFHYAYWSWTTSGSSSSGRSTSSKSGSHRSSGSGSDGRSEASGSVAGDQFGHRHGGPPMPGGPPAQGEAWRGPPPGMVGPPGAFPMGPPPLAMGRGPPPGHRGPP